MTRQKWGPALVATMALALSACSSTREEFEIVILPIEGTWILDASLEQDQGDMQCEVQDVHLNVIQQPENRRLFGGTANGGTLTCTLDGETDSRPFQALEITTGIQSDGTTISFNLSLEGGESNFLDLEGDLDELFWSGSLQGLMIVDLLGEDLAAFRGTWTAERSI